MNPQTVTPSPAACCAKILQSRIGAKEAERAAEILKSLADPARLRIVNLLANSRGPVCVCDITERIGLTQGTVSHHLRKLLDAGLITCERRGTWAFYSLCRDALGRLAKVLDPEGATR